MIITINDRQIVDCINPKEYVPMGPRYSGMTIDVGIDQSKSHTAIVVGPAGAGYSEYIEILGGGGDTDVFDVCALSRKFCLDTFKGANIRIVTIEDPITKNYNKTYKDKDGKIKQTKTAMDTHENRLKLSAIFSNYMFVFYDITGKHPVKVNNNDWKGAILPEEYRKHTHKKGSLDWHKDRGTCLADTNDNVTDAACILDYGRLLLKDEVILRTITSSTIPRREYKYVLTDYSAQYAKGGYQYNLELSMKENIDYVGNESYPNVGVIVMPVDAIPIQELYKESCVITRGTSSSVLILVGG